MIIDKMFLCSSCHSQLSWSKYCMCQRESTPYPHISVDTIWFSVPRINLSYILRWHFTGWTSMVKCRKSRIRHITDKLCKTGNWPVRKIIKLAFCRQSQHFLKPKFNQSLICLAGLAKRQRKWWCRTGCIYITQCTRTILFTCSVTEMHCVISGFQSCGMDLTASWNALEMLPPEVEPRLRWYSRAEWFPQARKQDDAFLRRKTHPLRGFPAVYSIHMHDFF